jgi:hypothetical protein
VAKSLDHIDEGVQASGKIQQRYVNVRKDMAGDTFQKASSHLRELTQKSRDVEIADQVKKVFNELKQSETFLNDVPELGKDLVEHGSQLGSAMIANVAAAMSSDPKALQSLEEHAIKLDQMCSSRSGGSWQPVLPRLLNAATVQGKVVMPQKLEALDKLLTVSVEETPDIDAVLKQFAELAEWCVGLESDLQERTRKLSETIALTLKRAFDLAMSNTAATVDLDRLIQHAKQYDAACQRIEKRFALGAAGLTKEFEKRKAGITLNDMLTKLPEYIEEQAEELGQANKEAQEKLRKLKPTQYKEKATPPIWRYKRKNKEGTFEDYKDEASAQVEKSYQEWLKKGCPDDVTERRFNITIAVDAAAPTRTSTASAVKVGGRERCKYGATCYQKNPEHRKKFCHPGDPDWEPNNEVLHEVSKASDSAPAPTSSDAVIPTSSGFRETTLSLDFKMMTQVNKTGGYRTIMRQQALTKVEVATRDYFSKVRTFVKSIETSFAKADAEMRLLDEKDRSPLEEQVSKVLKSMQPIIRAFMTMAMKIEDIKTIDEIVALLGERAEKIGLNEDLKDLRKQDHIKEFKEAYQPPQKRGGAYEHRRPKKWVLVRKLLLTPSKEPPKKALPPLTKELCQSRERFAAAAKEHYAAWKPHHLLKCRLALCESQSRRQVAQRGHATMRCQALLDQYKTDEVFCNTMKDEITIVLKNAAELAAQSDQPEVLEGIVKTARSLRCDTRFVRETAGRWANNVMKSACTRRGSLKAIPRIMEVLDTTGRVAKSAGMSSDELFPVSEFFSRYRRTGHGRN